MDVDLSTNLESFLPLVAPILSGHSEVAIGTRLGHSAHVRRRLGREVLSRGYNCLIHAGFRAHFSDAQCGFKALRGDVARRLLPLVEDDGWFFDTELLLLAERNGMRIYEVPVDWIEDLDSRVDLPSTIAGDLRRPVADAARVLARAAAGSRSASRRWRLVSAGRPLDAVGPRAASRGCRGAGTSSRSARSSPSPRSSTSSA